MTNELLLIFLTVFGLQLWGFEVPKNATIKVYDASGKQIGDMKRSEYKVVKLGKSKSKVKIVKIVETVNKCDKKNRVGLKLGAGKDGIVRKYKNGTYEVSEKTTPVIGIGYSRKVGEDVNLGVNIHSNETATIEISTDY